MSKAKHFAGAILDAIRANMYGMDEVSRICLIALYTGGHVLLEGNPGLGKTELVKSLGTVLKLPFGRIQFTPDLMPADITGTYMPDFENKGAGKLVFRKGPIFTSLLLADEINRATPKTQSAMLEAMAERQVTVLGEVKKLASPFMVLATQNPIDHEGTYNLPEAQADRFMFKTLVPVPDSGTLRLILSKQSGVSSGNTGKNPPLSESKQSALPKNPGDSKEKYTAMRRIIEKIVPLPLAETHVLNMFLASNRRFGEMEDVGKSRRDRAKRLVEELMTYGLGPRAAIALMLGAKAFALMFSRNSENADGPSLARIVIPALRHRVKLDIDWEYRYRELVKDGGGDESFLLEKLLADFFIATAPDKFEYRETVKRDEQMKRLGKGEGW